MPISFGDSLKIECKKQNVERDAFKTIEEMKNYRAIFLPSIFHTMCEEDGCMYIYNVNNDDDPVTGKWRKFTGGGGGGTYTDDGTEVDVLGIPKGTKFNDAPISDVLSMMFHPYAQPVVSLNLSVSKTLYDITLAESVSTVTLTANVTKKSKPITSVAFYVGTTLLEEVTEDVSDGGAFSYEYTPESPITSTTTLKVIVSDGTKDTVSTKTLTFAYPSYYGLLENSAVIDADAIKGLSNNVLKTTKDLTFVSSPVFNRIVYAYPKSLGEITSIKDANNFEYIGSYTKDTITIHDIDYFVFYLTDATTATDYKQVFK